MPIGRREEMDEGEEERFECGTSFRYQGTSAASVNAIQRADARTLAKADTSKIVRVRSLVQPRRPGDGAPAGLWERSEFHPATGGNAVLPDGMVEVFVNGDKIVEVALTEAVVEAIDAGRLEVVAD